MSDEVQPLLWSVAAVWRRERVSCPHPQVLQSYHQAALPDGAMEFLRFHLDDAACAACNAALAAMAADEAAQAGHGLADLRDRLLRSTATALRGPETARRQF